MAKEKWWKIKGYDSAEEYHFEQWLMELKELGHIVSIERQVEYTLAYDIVAEVAIPLKTKTKYKERIILQGAKYTADYVVEFERCFLKKLLDNNIACHSDSRCWRESYPPIILSKGVWVVDVKGDGDPFHDDKYFSMVRKFMFAVNGVFVDKQVVTTKSYKKHSSKRSIFESTFTPVSYQKTDVSKVGRKLHYEKVNCKDWVEGLV